MAATQNYDYGQWFSDGNSAARHLAKKRPNDFQQANILEAVYGFEDV